MCDRGVCVCVCVSQGTGSVITDTPLAQRSILRLPLTASWNNSSLWLFSFRLVCFIDIHCLCYLCNVWRIHHGKRKGKKQKRAKTNRVFILLTLSVRLLFLLIVFLSLWPQWYLFLCCRAQFSQKSPILVLLWTRDYKTIRVLLAMEVQYKPQTCIKLPGNIHLI